MRVKVLIAIILAQWFFGSNAYCQTKTYRFTCNQQSYELTASFEPSLCEYYRQVFNEYSWEYSPLFERAAGDDLLEQIAEQLKDLAKRQHLGNKGLADLAMNFVQSLTYDRAREKKVRAHQAIATYNPYLTVFYGAGICLDKAILSVALLKQLGFDNLLLYFKHLPNDPHVNHVAIGIRCPSGHGYISYNNKDYYFVETTYQLPIGVLPGEELGPASIKLVCSAKSQPSRIYTK